VGGSDDPVGGGREDRVSENQGRIVEKHPVRSSPLSGRNARVLISACCHAKIGARRGFGMTTCRNQLAR